jgi:aspartate kinase
MALLVLKFGGTSVGDIERIKHAAGKVAEEAKRGHKLVVVVSAMAGVTDKLIGYCRGVSPVHDAREHDSIVAVGEQITSGLMALALQQRGLAAKSFMGWQIPILTDSLFNKARILEIDNEKILEAVENGEIPVVAGFQGVDEKNNITTIGRGGSDTSAVAIAAAIEAERCDIYTDVDGVYTSDPRLVSKARKISTISYEEMLELASLGAKVLQTRSVEMAMRHRVPVQVLSTFGNEIGSDLPGTLVKDGEKQMEDSTVTGVAYTLSEGRITLDGIPDKPGIAAKIFGALAKAGVNVDTIVQAVSAAGNATDISFTVPRTEMDRAVQILNDERKNLSFEKISTDAQIAKISVVGLGMRSHPGVAALMFETLASKGINICAIETSEINISVLIAEEYAELAVRILHNAFGLDHETK